MSDIIVIKIGGGQGIDPAALAPQIAALAATGVSPVIVHGGSHETDLLATRLGHPPRRLVSPSGHESRRTDERTLEIFSMVYAGKINTRLVAALRVAGLDAVGLSGVDGALWRAERKDAIRAVEDGRVVIVRDDLSGRVVGVDDRLLRLLIADGRVPVLCPPAITPQGVAVNVDADRAAAATAGALGAASLLLLSNVAGVLADPADPDSLIASAADAPGAVQAAARGRMKNKVLAAEEALRAGVGRVVIGSARGPEALARALAGAGTVFEPIEVQA
jgi:acetylglutamate/LysW-gamma-L-alpha-aminoadipate kinase